MKRKHIMKRIISICICLCLALAFTACGETTDTNTNESNGAAHNEASVDPSTFADYTQYLGGNYSELPANFSLYESENTEDYVELLGPSAVSFDDAIGDLYYSGINESVKNSANEGAAGKLIDLTWMVQAYNNQDINIKEQEEKILDALVSVYGEYDYLDNDTYTWKNKDGNSIELVIYDDEDADAESDCSYYVIRWTNLEWEAFLY